MPSMNYCLFENTEKGLEKCLERLSDIESLSELSTSELNSASEIRSMAEDYIKWLDELTEQWDGS